MSGGFPVLQPGRIRGNQFPLCYYRTGSERRRRGVLVSIKLDRLGCLAIDVQFLPLHFVQGQGQDFSLTSSGKSSKVGYSRKYTKVSSSTSGFILGLLHTLLPV